MNIYRFIYTQKARFSIVKMSNVLGVGPSGYYKWLTRTPSLRAHFNKALLVAIKDVYESSRGNYGSPRIHQQLLKEGWKVSRPRVARLMARHGIRSKIRSRWTVTTDSSHTYRSSPNLLAGEFAPGKTTKAWVSDITYLPTRQGWLYITMIMDLADRKIIGWAMSSIMSAEKTIILAWKMACGRRRPVDGLIFHSDRGVQYACKEFRRELAHYPMVCQSMSRKGNCWDNAPAESFFKTLKSEARPPTDVSREQAKSIVFDYIETFYNTKRMHSTLGYQSPDEFAAKFINKTAAQILLTT